MDTLILIVVGIGIVWLIASEIAKNAGDRPLRAEVSRSRSEFLRRAFGITRDECQSVRFDGIHFHHPKPVPYESYTSVRKKGAVVTAVSNPALPHRASWRFQCLDGTPDLRYKNNPKTMHSERHYVEFSGKQSCLLHVYSLPGHQSVDALISKFAVFLCGAQDGNYEDDFGEFHSAYETRIVAEDQLKQKLAAIATCDAVLSASHSLSIQSALSNELAAKGAEASSRRNRLSEEANELRIQIADQIQRENAAIGKTMSRSKAAANLRTIAQFS